jgi:hypothetical protein
MKRAILTIIFFALLATQSHAAMYTDAISVNGTTCLAPSIKTAPTQWTGTVVVYGTWGGGTITWKIKSGASYIAMTDLTGVAYTSAADDAFDASLGKASQAGTDLQVCAVLAGATGPSLTVELYDNN